MKDMQTCKKGKLEEKKIREKEKYHERRGTNIIRSNQETQDNQGKTKTTA